MTWMHTSLIAQVLGKYRIVEELGSDGLADIYKGIQVGLDRDVAIKVLPPAQCRDREAVKRFRRESQATAKLSHPNIITIYDSGEQDGHYFYVMEFLKSDSLLQICEREAPLSTARTIKLGQDVLKALSYCHEREILHRNLTPACIRFDMRDNAIVTDFASIQDLAETDPGLAGTATVGGDLEQVAALMRTALAGGDVPNELHDLLGRSFASAKDMLAELKKVELKQKARKASKPTQAVPLSQVPAAEPASAVSGESSAASGSVFTAILAGPHDREALFKLIAITVPVFLIGLTAVLWAFGVIGRAPPVLVEKTLDVESTRASIGWKLDRACFAQVEYWPATSTGNRLRTRRVSSSLEHRDVLPDLKADTTYGFRFIMSYGAEESSADVATEVFELTTRPDIQVFNVQIDEYATHAMLTWETNLRTDTTVQYGPTEAYSDQTSNTEQRSETIHSVSLDRLAPDTTYHYRIVAADPRGRGQPKQSEDFQIHTSSSERSESTTTTGLVSLTRSYVDKLSRMTPDERQKLRDSIAKFTDLRAPLTAEEKKLLLATPTAAANEGEFATRLQMMRRWMSDLVKLNKGTPDWPTAPRMIEKQYYVSHFRGARRLDRFIQLLDVAERL